MELGRVLEFPARSFREARSQSLPVAIGPILRRANKHLHEIVVQRIVELALEAPFELRVIEVAWMKIEIISVHRNGFIFELDDDFDTVVLGARGKIQERMIVEAQLRQDAFETGVSGFRHGMIVK